MNLFELVAKLTLDSSEYDRALMAAKGSTAKAGKGMVASIEATKKRIGVAALGMGAAIGAFGVSSAKTGMEFDSAMSQVAATMGKTMDDLANETGEVDLAWGKFSGNLREYAQEMGAHTKFSAIESAEALNYMALAGYDTQKAMEMLPPVLSLAAAGNMELATASDMVTDASSALGLSQEQTLEMVDQMAMAASKSNTSVQQLGDAILRVGGTAKVMKGGTTEISTVLGLLADNGTKGAEAGTALRNILMSIQGGKFEKTFGAWEISAYDAQGNLRSLKDIFMDMNEVMEGMTDEEKTDIISKTFNARDLKNVNALLGTSAERWDQLSAAIEDSEGSAEKMADTQLDNLAGDITLLKSAFEGLQISVADKLTPAFRTVVQFLTWCIDHASTLGPIILGLATTFGTFAIAINIGNIIKSVTTAFAAFNAVLAANPIGIVVALIAGLIVAFVALYKNNEEFRNKVNAVWSAVQIAISNAVANIRAVFETLKTVVNSVRNTFEDVKSTISNKLDEAKQKVRDAISSIKNMFPFSLGKVFTDIKLPKFHVSGGEFPYGIGGSGTPPSFSVTWNKRAQLNPYMFSNATLFGAGEAGDEILYGRDALMRDIEAASGTGYLQAEFARLVAILEEWLPQLTNMDIVLDSGALVGELTYDIDRTMGRRQLGRDRGNAR